MSIKQLFILLGAGISFCSAHSGDLIADPELDFINIPESIRAEWGILPKPEVKRLDLQLNDNCGPTVFLAYNGVGSKAGTEWTAYHPKGDGYIRTFGIQFREDFFRAGKLQGFAPEGGLLVLYPAKGGGVLCRINLGPTGRLSTEELLEMDFADANHRLTFQQLFGREPNQPLSEEYFKNPPHKVIKVQHIRAKSSANADTPSFPNPTQSGAPKVEAPAKVATVSPKTDPQSIPNQVANSEGSVSESTRRWPTGIILIPMLATVILLWFFKKRRDSE